MSTTERPPATVDDWPIEQAAELVITAQLASVQMLQRKLRLGFDRCVALMGILERAGVVGPGEARETRKVLVPAEELDDVLARIRTYAMDMRGGGPGDDHAHTARARLVADTERLDEAHGGTGVMRGGLGTAEVAVRDEGALAEVYDAELVDDGPGEEAPQTLVGRIVQRPVHVITELRRSGRPAAAARAVALHAWWPIAGAGVVIGRWRDAHGGRRYERMIVAAEAAGDRVAVLEWETRAATERDRRHKRKMDRLKAVPVVARYTVLAALGCVVFLLVVGALWAISERDLSLVVAPIVGVVSIAAWLVWLLATCGLSLLAAGVIGGLLYLWRVGRRYTDPPGLFAPAGDGAGRDVVPDEGAILQALRNLGYPALDKRFKEGWRPVWVLGTGRDGKGWRTQLQLPQQVTVEGINDRKNVLAHNLVRLPVEVWVTEPKRQPGVMDLWVADQGLLTGPVAPYPLLREGTSDYFSGVPVGTDQRGEVVIGKLMAANYAIAGAMGSGKSTLVIDLCVGAMLDPLVDIDVYCMAYNVDYDPMRPRLRTLVKGDEDEHVVAAMDALRALRHEVTQRGKALAELGGEETKVTRALAGRDPRLRPRLVVFDECQELFRHSEHGAEAKELAIKVMTKARKTAITLVFVTPEPSADSLPRELAKVTSHGVCYAITDHQGNDAILGTGAHKRGVTAVTLVAGEDVGTAMARGFAPRPGVLRTFYIRKDETVDELTPIVKRAMALLNGRPVAALPARDPDVAVDYLADILEVIGDRPRVHTVELLRSLAVLDAATYGGWDTKRLKAETGLVGGKSGGTPVIRRVEVVALIAARGGEVGEPDGD